MKQVYAHLLEQKKQGKKSLAVLIDPDKTESLDEILRLAETDPPDFFFIGGSLLGADSLDHCISTIRNKSKVPLVLFPGSIMQVNANADALLLLSVISGRNADLLIGRHVLAAPVIRKSKLEIISTGYMLIDSGNVTTVDYISNTQPIPREKTQIAAFTALAGEQIGMKTIYLEAGSGAKLPVPTALIQGVRELISLPLIVGGGLKSPEEIRERCIAGADLIVTGNILEQKPELLTAFVRTIRAL